MKEIGFKTIFLSVLLNLKLLNISLKCLIYHLNWYFQFFLINSTWTNRRFYMTGGILILQYNTGGCTSLNQTASHSSLTWQIRAICYCIRACATINHKSRPLKNTNYLAGQSIAHPSRGVKFLLIASMFCPDKSGTFN